MVTVGTYLYAGENGGGRYIVMWGAMLFGGLQFLRGLLGIKAKAPESDSSDNEC
jgi:hypothetical protein